MRQYVSVEAYAIFTKDSVALATYLVWFFPWVDTEEACMLNAAPLSIIHACFEGMARVDGLREQSTHVLAKEAER